MSRPDVRNAIDAETAAQLDAALTTVETDESLWVGVLTGAGSAFSAGADLKATSRGEGGKPIRSGAGFVGLTKRDRRKPLIAAVNGAAVGGGCELALSCDIVVASSTAVFGIPEVKRSLLAAAGGLIWLPQLMSPAVAMQMALTGEPISAERAYQLGLVSELVVNGDVVSTALDIAETIAQNAPLAVRASREIVATVLSKDDDQMWQMCWAAVEELRNSDDYREGPQAFVEKRKPNWKGK